VLAAQGVLAAQVALVQAGLVVPEVE